MLRVKELMFRRLNIKIKIPRESDSITELEGNMVASGAFNAGDLVISEIDTTMI
jgi:hypothetical protein